LAGDAERVGDLLPRPAVADRLVDVRRLPHVEPPPQLGDRREPRVRLALAGGDAEQLALRYIAPSSSGPAEYAPGRGVNTA
jgi:hypothetical protein